MKVLVTGGSGFIGLSLAQVLLKRGHTVIIFDRHPPPSVFLNEMRGTAGQLSIVEGDICSDIDIARAFEIYGPATHVFQGAALTPNPEFEAAEPLKVIDVNLNGTVRVLAAAARFKIVRVIYASSLTVYGSHILGESAVNESSTPPMPDTLYGITKYAGECTALRLGQAWKLDVRAARIGSVFGPWERETDTRNAISPFAQVAVAAAQGIPVVLPGTYPRREMIYAADLAAGLIALMTADKPSHDSYNLSANLDWNQALQHWCENLATRIPGFQWRYAQPGEASNIDFHGASPRASMSADRAQLDLNWAACHSRDTALADYADWVANHTDYFDIGKLITK